MNVDPVLAKQLRIDKGWTQQQLAEVADLSLRTIQRVENQGVASMESVNALCAVLGITRDKLLQQQDAESLRQSSNTLSIRLKLAFVVTFLAGLTSGVLLMGLFL